MNTKVVKKFLYAPALFTALALIATSECLTIGAEEHTEQLTRRVTVFRETQKIKDGPVIAEYQIAVAKGEMALTTMIVNVTASPSCRTGTTITSTSIGKMAEALSGNRARAKASVTRATKPKWQITWSFGLIAAGFTITR